MEKGLADWGQDGARIQRLRDAADFAIYTPGSDAGLPVSVLGSFAPPADRSDAEAVGDQIGAIATGLLALLGIDADPIKSREHILISSILGAAWANGQELDLAALIAQIQKPPFAKIGVLDLDSFFPPKDRFELAMALNNLLAAPGFQPGWRASRSTSASCCTATPASRASRSSRSRTSPTPSACSSSRCC